jgi:neopullulanase
VAAPSWVRDAVFYQIFPDRFARGGGAAKPSGLESWDSPPTAFGFKGGDLFGVAERLDYLRDLGATALYFTPVFASAANHRYHTHDYRRVDPILGGDEALALLLGEAHRRGMRVILDGVFNHAGRGFYMFHHALENGLCSPYLDWFHFDLARLRAGRPIRAYPRGRGPLGYKAWWNLPALPKFNTDNPAVREYLFGVAERWLEFGIDGWRLDVPEEIDDDSFWREFRARVKAKNPEAYIVGEIWGEAGRWLRGDQFDGVMNYPLAKALIAAFCDPLDLAELRKAGGYRRVRPMGVRAFASAVDRLGGLYGPGVRFSQLNLLSSHDTPRFLTLARGDETALRLASAFLFTCPGAPCVYYGDEIGMSGGADPGCRGAFPWEPGRWNHGLREHFKKFISLRRAHAALRRGSFERVRASGGVYAFCRRLEGEFFLVALNLGREPGKTSLAVAGLSGPAVFQDVWSQDAYPARDGIIEGVRLPARGSLVLRMTRG